MAPEGPQRQRAEEHQGGVDLRAAGDLHELHAAAEREGRREPRLPTMQTPTEVVDQQHRAERRQHRRQQERQTQIAGGHETGGDQPEMQRRLVLVEIAARARDEPIARAHHVERHGGEPRLIGRPRVAQAVAREDEDEEGEDDPGEVAPPCVPRHGHTSTLWRPERIR